MSAAEIVFWTGVTWLGYVYLGYPALLALTGLILRRRPNGRLDYEPSVSVVIAARNEEKDIRWKVEETLAWDYPPEKLDVLVASDASEDRTDEILASINDRRLRWIRTESRGGKVRALNALVATARGDILFFTDANAHIGPECLRRMIRHFADERVGCVTGDSYVINDDSAVGGGAEAYWGLEKIIKRLQNRIGAVLVCDGAIFCLRRKLYSACRPELANDLELPLFAAHRGYWVLHEPEARVFERDTPSFTEEFQRRRRICSQGMLGMWLLRHTLRGMRLWQFVSHKFMRWLTLLPMALVLIGSGLLSDRPLYAIVFGVQLLFYSAAFVAGMQARRGKTPPRLPSICAYVVLGAAAALTGVVDALLGKRFAIWNIPTLSRGTGGETI